MDLGVDDLLAFRLRAGAETLHPLGVAASGHPFRQDGEHLAGVPADPYLGRNDLAEFRPVDVDVDHLGLGRITAHLAGNAVVEPHADGDQYVALPCLDVGRNIPVHPDHPLVEREIGRQGTQAQHRGRDV